MGATGTSGATGATGATGSAGPAGQLSWSTISSSITAAGNSGYVIDAPSSISIALPPVASLSVGDEIDLLDIGSGAFSVAAQSGESIQFALGTIPIHWVDCTAGSSAANLSWGAIASDATGANLIAIAQGEPLPDGGTTNSDLFVSTSACAQWTNATAGTSLSFPAASNSYSYWTAVAIDASGQHLLAASNFYTLVSLPNVTGGECGGGDIWISTDSGKSWTDLTPSGAPHGQCWSNLASDASGQHLVASAFTESFSEDDSNDGASFTCSGAVWTSADFGATWTSGLTFGPTTDDSGNCGLGTQVLGLTSDTTGKNVAITVSGGDVWTSSSFGQSGTWTNRTQGTALSGQSWNPLASDATGTHLVAGSSGSGSSTGGGAGIWTSADSGASWQDRTTGTALAGFNFFRPASDATGTRLSIVGGNSANFIYASSNGGASWADVTSGTEVAGNSFNSLASDAAGDQLVAIASGPNGYGDIWLRAGPFNQTSVLTGQGGATVRLVYSGAGAFYVADSAGPLRAQ